MNKRLARLSLLLFPLSAWSATVYQCPDADGKTVFTDHPCSEVTSDRIFPITPPDERLEDSRAAKVPVVDEVARDLYYGKILYGDGKFEAALPYLQRAAAAGKGRACTLLGMMYARGLGVKAEEHQALSFFRCGALADEADSQANLAYFYEKGIGTAPDPAQASYWYKRSADQGLDSARQRLEMMEGTLPARPPSRTVPSQVRTPPWMESRPGYPPGIFAPLEDPEEIRRMEQLAREAKQYKAEWDWKQARALQVREWLAGGVCTMVLLIILMVLRRHR